MKDKEIDISLLEYLQKNHCGEFQSVPSKHLEFVYGIKGSQVRQIINELRCKGNPICSDSNGYYYAENEMELRHSICQLSSRVGKIAKARNGLIRAIEQFNPNEQMKINPDTEN